MVKIQDVRLGAFVTVKLRVLRIEYRKDREDTSFNPVIFVGKEITGDTFFGSAQIFPGDILEISNE